MQYIQNYYTLFEPENKNVKATILILHGMQEHSGRYSEFAKYLADNGFAVVTYDHLGHGKTAKSQADLGFFKRNNPVEKIIDDAKKMTDYLSELYPNVPHFLFGHSMGSFIARCLLQEISNKFNGAIIMGTGGKVKGIFFAKAFLYLLNFFAPRHRSSFINNLFSKVNNKRFKNESDHKGTNWLSIDESNRNAFIQDELCGVDFTNNAFYALISLNVRATKKNWERNISEEFPFLFLSGIDDPIGDFGKGVERTVHDLQKNNFKNISMKLYDEMRHEILNEKNKYQVYEDIKQWIEKHL